MSGALVKLLLMILVLVNINPVTTFKPLPPEICDNGQDDDDDGKIDLNDEDCYCEPLERKSLIPNPSFEEQDCCPDSHTQLNCATGWIQATVGTPDYFHACDYDGTDMYDLPRIPDGDGFIAIIDGVFTGNFLPALKEYAGACLIEPTKSDTLYRLEFYTGFLDKRNSPDIEIALFGTTDCANLPLDTEDRSFGCPSNSPDWIFLGSAIISGENQWVKSQFKFRTDLEITAVAIGPGCSLGSYANNTYHLLDQLILKEVDQFDLGIKAKGQPCTGDLVFEIRDLEGYEYQWYKDGIAIRQATQHTLQNPPGKGRYQVRLENSDGCKISEIYTYLPPAQFVELKQTICEGEMLSFNNNQLATAGVYIDTLTSFYNCDSIVELELLVSEAVETEVSAKIFPDESFRIGSFTIDSPGEHTRTIPAVSGCDSTVYLQLAYYGVYIPNVFSPNRDGVNDLFSIYGDSDLKEINSLEIFDRFGALIYQGENLSPNEGWDGTINSKEAQKGVYVYTAQVLMVNDRKRHLRGILTLVR